MLELAQVLKKCKDKKPTLLLGNGFSMAYDSSIFSYASLLDAATFGDDEDVVRRLFESLSTSDFEFVARLLTNAHTVNKTVCPENDLPKTLQNLDELSDRIRASLGQVLIGEHPIASVVVPEDKANECANFLKNFSRIFTTNYDLLLYWVVMRESGPGGLLRRPGTSMCKFGDGFGRVEDSGMVTWPSGNSRSQCMFYLHGALHLFTHKSGVEKLVYSEDNVLIKQIREKLNENFLPHIVVEGSADGKRRSISRSPYLSHCLLKLQLSEQPIVSFGFGFADNDQHISEAIAKSKVSTLYIGVHGDEPTEETVKNVQYMNDTRKSLKKARENAGGSSTSVPDLNIHYYDTRSGNIWGN